MLFGFRNPRGDTDSVYSLLGSFLLDSTGAAGRHLRIHIEPATLRSVLNEVFGTEGPALAEQLFAVSEKHERSLESSTEGVKAAFDRAPAAADDDTEWLVTRCARMEGTGALSGLVQALSGATAHA